MINFNKFPKQVKYILGNEAAERFSFYGMRSILIVYMTKYLILDKSGSHMNPADATIVASLFMSACYFFPLIGGYIADRFWGKYKTILYISLLYCAGHTVLAVWENLYGLYVGLALIALGSGGIKPCVSAYLGDQFSEKHKEYISEAYSIFYFAINFGSMTSTIFTPLLLEKYNPSVAFALPGLLMFIATFVFWSAKKQYVNVAPTGKEDHSFFLIIIRL
jgi:POT family proton-dependent oligopeptide transporter